jgi:hypothetical protein
MLFSESILSIAASGDDRVAIILPDDNQEQIFGNSPYTLHFVQKEKLGPIWEGLIT